MIPHRGAALSELPGEARTSQFRRVMFSCWSIVLLSTERVRCFEPLPGGKRPMCQVHTS